MPARFRRHAPLLRLLLLAPPLAVMVAGLREPLHGDHVFRQAHVAANIEKYVAGGLSLHPATYNQDAPASLFDFPAYQLLVAALCRTLHTAPLPTARAVNLVSFVLACLVIDLLLRSTRVPSGHALFALAFFAWAPLDVFFFQAPLVDGLAVLLSLVSLHGYVLWDRRPGAGAFAAMAAAGVMAALIKNPVYFPFFVAILWHRERERGARSLFAPALLAFAGLIGAAVAAFKLFANAVNAVPGWLGEGEGEAYFGDLGERLQWTDSWSRVMATLTTEVLNPLTFVLALAAVVVYARRRRDRWASLYLGSGLGAAGAVLLFFNRHRGHNYYQLPLVFPLAFFAGYALHLALARARTTRGPAWARRLGAAAPLVVLITTLGGAGTGLATIARGEYPDDLTEEMTASGRWIQARTAPDDFVVYVLDTHPGNWNPAFLYFAKRDGYNLPQVLARRGLLSRIHARFAARYRRFLVFCPGYLDPQVGPRLEALGAALEEAGPPGRLYRFEEAPRAGAGAG